MNDGQDITNGLVEFYQSFFVDLFSEKLLGFTDKSSEIPYNIMFVGATGAGKSTTLNGILGKDSAAVGHIRPETQNVRPYRLDEQITLWDTPGLGEDEEADKAHKEKITSLLKRRKGKGAFIDAVIVIVEAGRKDFGTLYELLQEIIFPNIPKGRILFAMNQADFAMKGNHWYSSFNLPDKVLKDFLDEAARDFAKRVYETTGVIVERPIYYSARTGYNMDVLKRKIVQTAHIVTRSS